MNRWISLFLGAFFLGLCASKSLASEVIIKGRIQHLPQDSLSVFFPFHEPDDMPVVIQQHSEDGAYTISIDIQKPGFLLLKCGAFSLNLILSPNDDIQLNFDARDFRNTYTIEGSAANTYYLQSKTNPLWAWTATEKGFDHLATFLQFMEMMEQEKKTMKEYGVSGQLLSLLEYESRYFYIDQMMLLTRDYASYDRPIYKAEIDELLTPELINNMAAMACPSYRKFLFNLADFHWKYSNEEFKKVLYPQYGTTEENILGFYHAYWNKNLEEAPLELMLATCLSRWEMYNQIKATQDMYLELANNFPNSPYLIRIAPLLKELQQFWEIEMPEKHEIEIIEAPFESLEELKTQFEEKVTVVFIWIRSFNINGLAKKAMIHSALVQDQFPPEEVNFVYLTIDDPAQFDQSSLRDLFQYYRLRGQHFIMHKEADLARQLNQEVFKKFQYFPPVIQIFDKKGQKNKTFSSIEINKDRIREEIQLLLNK